MARARQVSEETFELIYQAVVEAGAYPTTADPNRVQRAVVKILRTVNLYAPKGY